MLPYVQPYIDNEQIAMVAAAGVVFVVALIIVTLITMKIADFIIDSRIGALDRTLGFLYGAARGILVVAVGAAVLQLAGRRQRRRPGSPRRSRGRCWRSIGTEAREHAARRSGKLDPEAACSHRAETPRPSAARSRTATTAGADGQHRAADKRHPADDN